MPNPLYTYILYMIWFGLVLWLINHCRLFNAKSSLYIYIRYIGFGLVGFYGISTAVGYLMPNPLYTYILDIYGRYAINQTQPNHIYIYIYIYIYIILNIYDLVWFGFMAYQPL